MTTNGRIPPTPDLLAQTLAWIEQASAAPQATIATLEQVVATLQDLVAALRRAEQARDVLALQVPIDVLRQALAVRGREHRP